MIEGSSNPSIFIYNIYMKNNYFNFENIENLDANQIFELSMQRVEEFAVEDILDFINDNITRIDYILDGYHEANVLNPSDALAHITLSKSLQSLCLLEHWIRKNFNKEIDEDEDDEDDFLEQDDEL